MYIDKLAKLSINQKIALISGKDFWTTIEIPEKSIPQIKVTDGPNGARGDLSSNVASACFPCSVASGASWDTELIAELAQALAIETRQKGAHILLGPTINLQRTPIGGRNFECFSEDPHLTSELAVSYVKALQKNGIGACPKHFVGNDTEYKRFDISSNIDAKTLDEIYLQPFERVTKEAKPWMMMAAYNAVNSVECCSNKKLNVDRLKNDWGFDGVLVSDWFAARDTVNNANGGLDLEMPGPTRAWGELLKSAVENGEVSQEVIDLKLARILKLMDRVKPLPQLAIEEGIDIPEHRALIRRAAAESMVVLKNDIGALPLEHKNFSSLAVIGPNAKVGQIMGGGSSFVNSHLPVHPLEGITTAFPDIDIRHSAGCTNYKFLPAFDYDSVKTPNGDIGFFQEGFANDKFSGEPIEAIVVNAASGLMAAHGQTTIKGYRLTGFYSPDQTGKYELGIYSAGQSRLFVDGQLIVDNWTNWKVGSSFFGFGSDEVRASYNFEKGKFYKVVIEYLPSPNGMLTGAKFGIDLPLNDSAIADAAKLAAECNQTILILGSNADWEGEGHDRESLELPGLQNQLAEAVLEADPETIVIMNVGSPVAMPWYDKAKSVLVSWFPGQEMGNALGDVLLGKVEPSGRLPFTWPKRLEDHPAYSSYPGTDDLQMPYTEGRLIGHRWYDKQGIEPLAAFGYGLGYGDVQIDAYEVSPSKEDGVFFEVNVCLYNQSKHKTKTTVQVYAEVLNPEEGDEPIRRLIAFGKETIDATSEKKTKIKVLEHAVSFLLRAGEDAAFEDKYILRVGLSSSALAPVLVAVESAQSF